MPLEIERKHVLIVDDDASNARALATLLGEDGAYASSFCISSTEAWSALEKRRPDALLLDVELRGESGLDLLRKIRARFSPLELPIIMVTAHHSGKEIATALRDGANDYVGKPVDLDVLLARLATHLNLAELARLKDDVLRMASHDLKNPLTAVLGNARLILDTKLGTVVDAELHESARAILRRAGYMHRLINDFLDQQAARDGQLRVEVAPVALGPLVQEIAQDQRDYAEVRGVELSVSGEPTSARADGARLAQVLHNLVGNAVKFTPRGGHIELFTSRTLDHAFVEVRDDGPGLGDEPESLFRAGAQGPARSQGGERSTGLGLYIARVLVEKQGGTITAENRVDGHGAVFRITLPVA
jgi:two-component system, sensor histidine kinase and response regulator